MPKKPIRVSTDNVLYQKTPEGVYPIEESDWKRIKNLAQGIKCPKKIFELLGAACWGVSGSAFIQCICYYIQLEDKSKWYEGSTMIMLVVFIVFLILGLLLFLLDKEKTVSIENIGKQIVSEMNTIETKYIVPKDDAELSQDDTIKGIKRTFFL